MWRRSSLEPSLGSGRRMSCSTCRCGSYRPQLGLALACGAELIATFGLLLTIFACASTASTAYAVGLYITAAYWFTASTAFANPAVTIARTLSDTFAGIRPQDVAPFLLAQFAGALVGAYLYGWLYAGQRAPAPDPAE